MKLIILIGSFLIFSNLNYCQNKPGFFDYQEVKKSFKYYIKNLEKVELLKTKMNDSLISLVNSFKKRTSSICGNYTQLELEKQRKYLIEQHEKIETFRVYALNELKKEQDNLESITEEKISAIMKSFCGLKGILFLSKRTDLLYCENCEDYTAEFKKFINLKI
ncbi:hypothetical protein [Neotamlana laminarinivorans]|uniref:Uncharacterized protein n=1 Tax=Neotamlana laminarinivorans TaxID=2883124 RepID=A0A9X1I2N8_9FLAO|nr:hypothetical protein [Tamlana laminarinivorans]MCB4800320.1 hypothetical protein [Tamlana laminarinivorans]